MLSEALWLSLAFNLYDALWGYSSLFLPRQSPSSSLTQQSSRPFKVAPLRTVGCRGTKLHVRAVAWGCGKMIGSRLFQTTRATGPPPAMWPSQTPSA